MAQASRDQNRVTTLLAVSSADGTTPVVLWADPVTHRLLVDIASGGGTVTSVSVVTANGISGTVATPTTTPAITLSLGNITPTGVNVSGLTASQIVATDGSKNLQTLTTATYPSLNELSYVKGVNSPIQTQLDAKGTGTVTTVSVVSTNGFAGSVATATTTPAITISTTITGIIKGNGTAISAASAGTDYVAPGAITTSGLTMATARLLGRSTASTGAVEEITVGSGLSLSAGTLSATGGSGITIGSTTITSGTNTRILYNNAGVVGEYTLTGTGTVVAMQTSPSFTTPVLGVATATSVNGLTITTTTGTLTIANSKTATINNSITFAGTDSTTMTFPTTSATLARTDAGNTFTGVSTASAWVLTSPTITTKISPTTDDGAPLGDTTHNWSDLFLASGAVLNFADGNSVITHSSAVLEVTTGDLRVTTAGTNSASVVTVGGTQTLTNKTLTAAKIANAGYLADGNGNELIIFTTTASAVNEITIANAATGNNPSITASGGDSNVGFDLVTKGSGTFNLKGNSTQAATLRLYEDTDDGSNYTSFKVGTQSGDIDYVLPTAQGAASTVLTNNGSGTLSWAAASGGVSANQSLNTDETQSTYILNTIEPSTSKGWTLSNLTLSYKGNATSFDFSSTNGYGYVDLFPTGSTNMDNSTNLELSNNKEIRLKFALGVRDFTADFPGKYLGVGFVIEASESSVSSTTSNNKSVKVLITDTQIITTTASGSARTQNTFTAIDTNNNWNIYEIVWAPGTNVKFYANGSLLATHSTNEPTGTDTMRLVVGCDGAVPAWINNFVLASAI